MQVWSRRCERAALATQRSMHAHGVGNVETRPGSFFEPIEASSSTRCRGPRTWSPGAVLFQDGGMLGDAYLNTS
jgi:hypothetical protein